MSSYLPIKIKTKIKGEYDLERELLQLLMLKGYPEDSFEFHWQQGENVYSLVIINSQNKELLAVIEYHISDPNPVVVTSESIGKLVNKYNLLVADPKVHFYIVNAVKGQDVILVNKILPQTKNAKFPVFLPIKSFLNFQELKNDVLGNQKNKVGETENSDILKLRKKVDEIEELKTKPKWGPEYKVWEDLTKKLIKNAFGQGALELFEKQKTVILNDAAYLRDLGSRKVLLEEFLANKDEYIMKDLLPADVGTLKNIPLKKNSFLFKWFRDYWVAPFGVLVIGSMFVYYVLGIGKPEKSNPGQEVNSSLNSISTNGQMGGTNTVNNNLIFNQVATETVQAAQDGDNVSIYLNQLKYPFKGILFVARNGQTLVSPDDWIEKKGLIILFNAKKDEKFVIQYTY